MVANQLGLLSSTTQIQQLAQSHSNSKQQQHQLSPNSQQQQQQNPNSPTSSWMWNPKQGPHEDDDSWEVRAFAEDTSNAMGTTWPPRSYTCTFCRREFRSAQALGGHMNVHRRDRARLHQTSLNHPTTATANLAAASSNLLIPTQDPLTDGGLCLLYSIPNPNGIFSPTTIRDSPSISPYQKKKNNLNSSFSPPINFLVEACSINTSPCHSTNTEPSGNDSGESKKNNSGIEELDLELRL
ncbi:hypothetical protein LguiA_034011 [Lonicera macranthoides]